MVSINRSGQKEGSLVSSKMLAIKQVTSGLCEFTHAHREETLAELCVWPMVECSPSLLKAPSSIPSTTKQNQVKSLLCGAEGHGACTGTVPLDRGRRIRQEDQVRQRCSHLPGRLDSGPALPHHASTRCSLPVSLCVRWGHKLFTQPSAHL